jgi:serine protease Do
MAGRQFRIIVGTTAALALVVGVAVVALSIGGSAQGDGRPAERLWTEKSDPAPLATGKSQGFSKLVKEISPAVVNISTTRSFKREKKKGFSGNPFFEFYEKFFGELPKHFRNRGLGSGFVIHPQGYILTNHHVVENADEVKVKFIDEREYTARIIGSDPKTDIALIKIDPKEDLPVAALGDSDRLEVGEWVVAIGNPFGLHNTVTAGIVSAKERRGIHPDGRELPYADFIQTDASINPGNSGGPLLNLKGEVVGINTAINAAGQGIGFAIPVNMVKVLLPQLKARGRVVRSYIGVQIQAVTRSLAKSFGLTEAKGALVAEVVPDGPAAKAGIKPGDIIVNFNGHPIRKYSDLPWLASTAGVGNKVQVTLVRNGQEMKVEMTLAEFPAEGVVIGRRSTDPSGAVTGLGITVTDVTPALREKLGLDSSEGAVVTEVQEGSEAAQAGLQPNDVILKVNLQPVRNASDLEQAAAKVKSGEPISLYIRREKSHLWLAFVKK